MVQKQSQITTTHFVGTVIAVISVIFENTGICLRCSLHPHSRLGNRLMKSRIMKKKNSVKGWQGVL